MHVHVKVDIVGISGGCGLLVCIQRDPWYYINTPILHGHAGLVVPYSIVEYTPSAILAPFVLLRPPSTPHHFIQPDESTTGENTRKELEPCTRQNKEASIDTVSSFEDALSFVVTHTP
jgi:hypothetical protein